MTQLTESQRRILSAARSLLGVKWRHRGRTRVGLDCVGFPGLTYAECGVALPDRRDYGREPIWPMLRAALSDALHDPIWEGSKGACTRSLLQPADVVVMAPASQPRHVAMVGDDEMHGLSLIHADGLAGCVIEHGLSDMYLKQIVCIFRRPLE